MARKKQAATNGSQGVLEHLAPGDLLDSPFNPRKTFDEQKIDDIAASAKKLDEEGNPRGIYTALLARPMAKGNKRELVFGHRRKRGAIRAGLKTVPVIVRQMSDADARIAQQIENLQREDVPPLEEADGFQALIEKDSLEVLEIAARVGRSKSYVYLRLQLCGLIEAGRKLLLGGKLLVGAAELVARIDSKKLQAQVIKVLKPTQWSPEPHSVSQARKEIEQLAMLKLADAPFDVKSKTLVPDAEDCKPCPKRTGGNPDLFGDHENTDLCTDPVCFKAKADASWKQRNTEHKKAGGVVMPKTEVKKLFPFGNSSIPGNCGLTQLDRGEYIDGEHSTYRKMLGKEAVKLLPTILARDPRGGVHELVKNTDMRKVLKEAGKNKPGRAGQRGGSQGANVDSAAEKKLKARQRQDQEVKRRIEQWELDSVTIKAMPAKGREFWKLLAVMAIQGAWHDTCKAICSRHGLERVKQEQPEDTVLRFIDKGFPKDKENGTVAHLLTEKELRGLTLVALCKPGQQFKTEPLKAALKFFKINTKKQEGKMKDQVKKEAAAKAKEAKAKKAKKTKRENAKRKKTARA